MCIESSVRFIIYGVCVFGRDILYNDKNRVDCVCLCVCAYGVPFVSELVDLLIQCIYTC